MKAIVEKSKIISAATMLAAFALLAPSSAAANTGGDVVVLITEIVGEGINGEEPEVGFWWSSSEMPRWTASDDVVLEALRRVGIEPMMPGEVNISRIYRRPALSTANAAQLGALIDGQRVLVGKVEYRRLSAVAPLGYRGVEATAEVELVPAGASDGISLQRFTVTRVVYGHDEDVLLEQARQLAGAALGEVMGRSLIRASGELGTADVGPLLTLRNVERAENLERIRQRLLEIDEVHRVVERWASEGVIALQVNPGTEDSAAVADYAFRVLENHDFDEFRIQRSQNPSAENVVEFWVESRIGGF